MSEVEAEALLAEIEQVLDNFDKRAGGIVAVALLMKTGIPVAARVRANIDETFLSASLATLLNVAVDLSDKLFLLKPARVILDTEAGSLILRGIEKEDMVLVAIFKKQHLGAMILLVEQAVKQLAHHFRCT